MILVIDNYDSFTYNLVQYLGELGKECAVYRNDKLTIEDAKKLNFDRIVISPGPGVPDEAGISKELIAEFAGKVPILGVCLGHQAIAEVFGAKVVRAQYLMHGKTSEVIYELDESLFFGVENPFTAARYHSLTVEPSSINETPLKVIAKTADNTIMALKHKDYDVTGIQFHPESILTKFGHKILSNFLSESD